MESEGDEPDRVRERPPDPPDVDAAFRDGGGIDRALSRAVRDALGRHKKLGNPIVASRNGKIVWIPADQIPVDE